MSETIKSLAGLLAEAPMTFVATLENAIPRVRPLQFLFEQDGRLWYCTSKKKKVFAQLQANKAVEIAGVRKDMTTIRLNGSVVLDDDNAIKERILQEQPFIKKVYRSANNPDFSTFYLEHGTYFISDFSGQPPREGKF